MKKTLSTTFFICTIALLFISHYSNSKQIVPSGNESFKFISNPDSIQPKKNEIHLSEIIEPRTVRIPNAFMPSSTIHANRIFRAYFNVPPLGYSLKIFNSWGAEVFHSSEPTIGWDGMVRHSEAPAGGYVYRLSYVDYEGNTRDHNGILMLIR